MLQTRTADLMELFVELFDGSATAGTDPVASTLISPMAALSAPPVPLSDALSADGSVLTRILEQYAEQSPPERAAKFSELALLVADVEVDFYSGDEDPERQLDFVYPVV